MGGAKKTMAIPKPGDYGAGDGDEPHTTVQARRLSKQGFKGATILGNFFVAIAVLGAPSGAGAQQLPNMPRIGVLSPFIDSEGFLFDAFRQGLRERGYVEGRTVAVEYRSADGRLGLLPGLAADLVGRKVDVIVTSGPTALRAAKQASATIPIVMGAVGDAVDQGFVASLARPGGNVTGSSWLNPELSAKRLEILKEAFPAISRVAVLRDAIAGASSVMATETAARSLGIKLVMLEVRDTDEFESVFDDMAREQVAALEVLHGPLITSRMRQIAELAAKTRLPAIFPDSRFVEFGGLMSYGPSFPEMYRKAAFLVDKILKGAKPGDLPVEQPTKFELVINLKTAKALGITIPPSVLARADEVIE